MAQFETDYLIVGAGAVGLAFADTLIDEDPDCHITIVDKHARPGGHWNDAYSFVKLHQPSATYGVNSMELCPNRVDLHGHNKGMYPLASQSEILAYYERLMNDRLIPSGRVRYVPLAEYREGHRIRSIFSGKEAPVTVRRKLVDATWFQTSVPSTHKPGFEIGEGARLAIPGDLPKLWREAGNLPDHYMVLGGGKTAMDTVVWLIEAGVDPDRIGWVRPRDSWMFNRRFLQPAHAALDGLLDYQEALVLAAASSSSGDEMFAKLGEQQIALRIDPTVTPSMFHYAVISEGEIDMLRQVRQVYRHGRVSRIERGRMLFGGHPEQVAADTLFIDCTATAVPFSQRKDTKPFFDGNRITLQLAMVPFVPYSAALAAFLEANFDTDEEKNALAPSAPLTDTTATYPYAVMANLVSTGLLGQNPKTNAFNAHSRLHPTGPEIARLIAQGSPKLARLQEVGKTIAENMPGVIRLGMQAQALHEAT